MEKLQRLRFQTVFVLLAAAAVVAAGATLLKPLLGVGRPFSWFAGAILFLAAETAILWTHLGDNRPPWSLGAGRELPDLYPTLGSANGVTFGRGLLIALLGGFLFLGGNPESATSGQAALLSWLPALLYTGAILLDYLDGLLARVTRHPSRLGEILENEIDSIGVFAAATYLVVTKRLPSWFVIVGIARYLFLFGVAVRRRSSLPAHELKHTISGKVIAGLMMGFLSVGLWPIVASFWLRMAAPFFFVAFVGGFLRDWLAVSGAIDLDAPGYLSLKRVFSRMVLALLPLLARASCAAGAIALVVRSEVGWPAILLGSSGFVFIGVAGRTFILIGMAVVILASSSPAPAGIAFVLSGLVILFCGTGPFSIWKPEEVLFGRKAYHQ